MKKIENLGLSVFPEELRSNPFWTMEPGTEVTLYETSRVKDCNRTVDGVTYLSYLDETVKSKEIIWPGIEMFIGDDYRCLPICEAVTYDNGYWEERIRNGEFCFQISLYTYSRLGITPDNFLDGRCYIDDRTYLSL